MAILLFLLWIIWNGKVNAEIILFGVALTALVLLFAVKVLGYSLESERRFWRNSPLFLRYAAVLIKEILKASLAVAGVALSSAGKPDPVISERASGQFDHPDARNFHPDPGRGPVCGALPAQRVCGRHR